MKVCYFVSEYPAVSHTFIRREIVALEQNGITVFRVSLRRNALQLVDKADLKEKERTKYVFDESFFCFLKAFIAAFAYRPKGAVNAIVGAARMMRRSNRSFVFHLFYLAEAFVIAKWIIERKVQHIHSHFGANGAEVAMLAHLLTGVPYSFTVHGPGEFDRPEYLGLAEKVKHAAFTCVISSFTGSQLQRWIPPEQWKKIKVVRCGLDADFLVEHATTWLSRDHLVSVGRLSGQKGQLVLLEALAILAREGVPFRMTIAGDGPLRSTLEQRIRELGLDHRVRIAGWLTNSEVRALIMDARALILPSFAEGLPVVLMESLALGRPVVTTYVGANPELVTDGVCGWLVPAGDVEQLARAMKQCLSTSDLQIRAMGQAGRERVVERHDIGRECRKLADLFSGFGIQAPLPPRSSEDPEVTRAEELFNHAAPRTRARGKAAMSGEAAAVQ